MADPVLERLDRSGNRAGRMYVRHDLGRIVPSVTTVVSLTPKPYLMNWVVKLAADWTAWNLLDLMPLEVDERAQRIKDATTVLREEGARKGTALHDFAEQYVWIGGTPRTWPEEAVVEIVGLLQPRVLFTEAMIWNGATGYAGTIDGVWQVGDETWLIDWKSSKSRSAEWAIQLLAYSRAETIFDGRGNEYPMPHIDRLMVLWTPYEGDWQVFPVLAGPEEWAAFVAALEVIRWHEARGIGVVFGPAEHEHNKEGTE